MTSQLLVRRPQAWVLALAGGSTLIGAYFLLPTASLTQSLAYDVIGLVAVVLAVIGIRIHRPANRVTWWMFVLGIAFSIVADLVSTGYDVLGYEEPVPSLADPLYLASYPFFVIAVMQLSRRRRESEAYRRLDAAIVSIGALAVFWSLFIHTTITDASVSLLGRLTLTAYPVMDLGLIFIVVSALLTRGVRTTADVIVALSMGFMLVGDFVYEILVINDAYDIGNPIDITWLGSYLLIGIAALHPSMADMPDVISRPPSRSSWMPLVTLAAFTPPFLMLVDPKADVQVLAIIAIVSALLVMVRMSGLFGNLRENAKQLSEHAEALQQALVAREMLEADLRHQAFHDSLTGLANRALLYDRIEHAVAAGDRSDRLVAVMLCDIDGFKTVNDSLGHQAGDDVLSAVARRLRSVVRPGDTVARLGGDEFAVLIDSAEESLATHVADRILAAVREPCIAAGQPVRLSASVGIAFGRSGKSAELLVSEADAAMYAAKADGKNRFELFEDSMRMRAIERLRLTSAFGQAIERREFHLVFQPLIGLGEGNLQGFEALVRWHHPTLGIVPPLRFIELAEETGFIIPLGRWVLESACETAMSWEQADGVFPSVSVNLSAVQFRDRNLVSDVRDILARTGLPGERLILEITESALIGEYERILPVLRDLKDLGIRIAIDDFGTGHSSLGRLQRFPVDILKIDKLFVDQLNGSSDGRALVEAIIRLARQLAISTIAEGIEVPAQRDALAGMGCDGGQGYLLSRPLEPHDAAAYVRERGQITRPAAASA